MDARRQGALRGPLARPGKVLNMRDIFGRAVHVLRQRNVGLVVALLVVATGLLFSFFWYPVVGHRSGWVQPGDLWGTYRSAQYVAWGDIGDISRAVTLPGIAVLLAPVALLGSMFGLVAGAPMPLAHPSVWPVLAPTVLLLGASVLVPLDTLARRRGITGRRRFVLSLLEGAVLWPVVAMWGHPEDALAIGTSILALTAAGDRRWRQAGWWFGLSVAFQPFVLALLPLLGLGLVPGIRPRVAFVCRSAAPSLALLAIPLVENWHLTITTVLQQANYPSVDHPTPWLFLAPLIRSPRPVTQTRVLQSASGFHVFHHATMLGPAVGTGPGHLIALAVGLAVGLWAWRRPPSAEGALWLSALCLALRCVFESVEDPFYVWPALALLLVAAAAHRSWRLPAMAMLAGALTVFAEYHLGPWTWYLPVVGMLGAGLACAWPARGVVGQARAASRGSRVSRDAAISTAIAA